MRKKSHFFSKFILTVFVFFQYSYVFLVSLPRLQIAEAANFTNASDTLSNSRFSFRSHASNASSGASYITITADGDPDTDHLFPKDTVCFAGGGLDGCSNQTAPYTVASVVDTTHFNIATPLTAALTGGGSDYVIATQSATHTIVFTTTNAIPSNGDILITVPAVDADNKTNDGFPDTSSAIGTNGFDLGGNTGVGTTDAYSVSSSGCNNNWIVNAITAGTGSTDHTIRIDRSTDSCAAASTITVTIGNTTKKMINPAPLSSGHTQGTSDVYTINVKSRDGSDQTLDQLDIKVAPVEAVLVSATVDETLTFQVQGVGIGSTACNQALDVTSTAMSIPWGTLSTADSFKEAAQQLTVSTNADAGYTVKIEENDQMGKDGVTCTGASAGESVNCILDTTCGASACTEAAARDWTDAATYHGLGISLQDVDGTDAVWDYDGKAGETTCTSGTFCAREIADQEASETKATIMTNTAPVNSKDIYTCFRMAISNTQPAGYYFNKVKFTATATF